MGDDLLPHARIILNERDRAVASIKSLRGAKGEILSICTDAAFAARRLPLALHRIAHSHPNAKVKVIEASLRAMLEMVRENKVDFALCSKAPYLDLSELTFEPLSIERAGVLARAGHPLLAGGPPTREALWKAKWIVPDHASVIEGWSQIFIEWKLLPPPITLHSSSPYLIRNCLLNGDFISVADCTTYAAELEAGTLVQIDLGMPAYQRPAGLFRRSGNKFSRTAKALIATLQDVCREEPQ